MLNGAIAGWSLVILIIALIALAVMWFLLPVTLFEMRSTLNKALQQQRETNELMQALIKNTEDMNRHVAQVEEQQIRTNQLLCIAHDINIEVT